MRTFITGVVGTIISSTPALASQVTVPEPSMLGIFAGGIAAIAIASRLRNRK